MQILLHNGANVNAFTETKINPLAISCINKFDDIVEVLLKGGAEVNTPGALFGFTPLCWACSEGCISTVEILLRHNADVNLRCNDGSSPLSLAIKSGNKTLVNLLKQNGARV